MTKLAPDKLPPDPLVVILPAIIFPVMFAFPPVILPVYVGRYAATFVLL